MFSFHILLRISMHVQFLHIIYMTFIKRKNTLFHKLLLWCYILITIMLYNDLCCILIAQVMRKVFKVHFTSIIIFLFLDVFLLILLNKKSAFYFNFFVLYVLNHKFMPAFPKNIASMYAV